MYNRTAKFLYIRRLRDLLFSTIKKFLENGRFLSQGMRNHYVFTFANDLKFCFVIFFTKIEDERLWMPPWNEKKQIFA